MIGQMIGSTWYWCIDQEMVQRVFSAKSSAHSIGGTVMAGFLKLLPVFIITVPGMIARAMYEKCNIDPPMESPWCATNLTSGDNSNKAYPYLIIYEFPEGVIGTPKKLPSPSPSPFFILPLLPPFGFALRPIS